MPIIVTVTSPHVSVDHGNIKHAVANEKIVTWIVLAALFRSIHAGYLAYPGPWRHIVRRNGTKATSATKPMRTPRFCAV